MSLDAVVVVPAAPLLLPVASPAQPAGTADAVAALRADVDAVLAGLPDAGTALLLACGDELLLHHATSATLASYGLPDVHGELAVDDALLADLGARGQAPRVHSGRLDGDLAVLALLVTAARPQLRVVAAEVPRLGAAATLEAAAAGIGGALSVTSTSVVVVAAGDLAATLSTTSPGYLVEGADEVDAAMVAAVADVDPDALLAVGAATAERVQARGWAPLVVATRLARVAGCEPSLVRYHAPRGVGQLVAG